ncbi:MAG TPA: hypothetical protein VF939_01815 [Puia sp.]
MEKYTTWRRLSTYSVNRQMIQNIAETLNNKVPSILHFGNANAFSNHTSLTIHGSDIREVYNPLSKYTQLLFNNDTEALTIELLYKEEGDSFSSLAFVLEMKFGHWSGDSFLSIALQDYNKPREKTIAIEDALLAALAPNKNRNWITYPNDFVPTLVFVAGFLIGLSSLMFTNPFLKILCVILFGTAIYYVAHRFTKGYCDFESRHQKKLDLFLNIFTGAVAIFILVVVLSSL